MRAFLLIEAPGAWGIDAVSDNRLPRQVKTQLARTANRHNVRLLFIRRHGRSTPGRITVFAAYADPMAPWAETASLRDPADLLNLDLASLGAGRSPGLTALTSPLFLVCTHGKHDICCAERGRPIAAALHQSDPDATWEVSHIGGDRFAGNMLVLPDGLYYGRLSPAAAVTVAERHRQGHLEIDYLRGRCGYPFPVQAAEIFLRRHLGQSAVDALRLTSRGRHGVETEAVFTDGTRSWTVAVETTGTPADQLTCRAPGKSEATAHLQLGITAR